MWSKEENIGAWFILQLIFCASFLFLTYLAFILLSQFFKYSVYALLEFFGNQNPILTSSEDLWSSTIIRLPSCFESFLAASTGQILKTPTHTHTHSLLRYIMFFSTLLLSFCIIAILLQFLYLKLNQVTHPFYPCILHIACKMWKINDVKYSAISTLSVY